MRAPRRAGLPYRSTVTPRTSAMRRAKSQLVLDITEGKTIESISVGDSPEGVDISTDGKWVSVAVEESTDVVFVDTRDNTKAHVVRVQGKNPEHAVFSPDERQVFVSAEEDQTIDVIQLVAGFARRRIGLDAAPILGSCAGA